MCSCHNDTMSCTAYFTQIYTVCHSSFQCSGRHSSGSLSDNTATIDYLSGIDAIEYLIITIAIPGKSACFVGSFLNLSVVHTVHQSVRLNISANSSYISAIINVSIVPAISNVAFGTCRSYQSTNMYILVFNDRNFAPVGTSDDAAFDYGSCQSTGNGNRFGSCKL